MIKSKIGWITLLVILVAIVSFGLIIHMVVRSFSQQCSAGMTYNKELKECVDVCEEGEKYYLSLKGCSKCPPGQTFSEGSCIAACESDETQCGTDCINPAAETCTEEGACPIQSHCRRDYTGKDGKKHCCPNCVGVVKDKDGKITGDDCCKPNYYVSADGTCGPCGKDKITCGPTCCNSNQQCCKGQCCPINKTCDQSGTCCAAAKLNQKTHLCCEFEGGGTSSDTCCSAGEVVKDNKCMIPCPPTPAAGVQSFCDPDMDPYAETCDTVTLENGSSFSGCTKHKCTAKVEWHPVPANLYEPSTAGSAGIPVCKGDNGKLWFCAGSENPAEQNLAREIDAGLDSKLCTELDCWHLLDSESGSTFNNYDTGTGKCTATIDCSKNNNTNKKCALLLATDSDQPGWNDSLYNPGGSLYNPDAPSYNSFVSAHRDRVICKDKNGTATGQICPDSKVCNVDGDCLPPYVLIKEGDSNTPATVSCRPKTAQDMVSDDPTFNTEAACLAELNTVPCPQGFARAGTEPDVLQCYRYGFPTGWNPATSQRLPLVPCQRPAYYVQRKPNECRCI